MWKSALPKILKLRKFTFVALCKVQVYPKTMYFIIYCGSPMINLRESKFNRYDVYIANLTNIRTEQEYHNLIAI